MCVWLVNVIVNGYQNCFFYIIQLKLLQLLLLLLLLVPLHRCKTGRLPVRPKWPPSQWSLRSIGIEVVNVGVSSSSCFFIFSICCSL